MLRGTGGFPYLKLPISRLKFPKFEFSKCQFTICQFSKNSNIQNLEVSNVKNIQSSKFKRFQIPTRHIVGGSKTNGVNDCFDKEPKI